MLRYAAPAPADVSRSPQLQLDQQRVSSDVITAQSPRTQPHACQLDVGRRRGRDDFQRRVRRR